MNESLVVIRGPIGAGKSSIATALRDLMPTRASVVETDAIKRMIDPSGSSEWRRDVAHESAAFMVGRLLQVPRTTIIEAHTKYPDELSRLARVAMLHDAPLVSVLLTAPLDVCYERAAARTVPGISYEIDRSMVENYYCNLEPQPNDLVFNTTQLAPAEIAQSIQHYLKPPSY